MRSPDVSLPVTPARCGHGQYVLGAVGAAMLAFGVDGLGKRALAQRPGGGPFVEDGTRSAQATSELERAQATVEPDLRAEAVFGETASSRPRPNDPVSAADLQTAREWIADVSGRNPNVRLASPNPSSAVELAVWRDAVRASHAARQRNLPQDLRHFFMRQEGGRPAAALVGQRPDALQQLRPVRGAAGRSDPAGQSRRHPFLPRCPTTFAHVLSALALVATVPPAPECRDDQMRQFVAQIETVRTVQELALLRQKPVEAAACLVRQLCPVDAVTLRPEDRSRRADDFRMIWSVRALRCLTGGKDFCAPTAHSAEMDHDRKQFLPT